VLQVIARLMHCSIATIRKLALQAMTDDDVVSGHIALVQTMLAAGDAAQ
jgi:hypothetical protein